MALFWSKKPKAEKNYSAEKKGAKAASLRSGRGLPEPREGQKAAASSAGSRAETVAKAVYAPALERFGDAASVIIRPHITEKSGILSQSGVYTFQVSEGATKPAVAKAMKALYKIVPVKVAMVTLPAKSVFVKGRRGTVSGIRKALVTVKKGDTIDFV